LIEARGKRMSMLFIEAVKAKHMGVYTCIAENNAGVAEQFSQLRVNGLFDCGHHYSIYVFLTHVFY
jgi:hypothetical protein